MTVQVHQVLTSLAVERGGMTRNTLTRARLMAERYNQTVRVLVLNFTIDWDATCSEYRRLGFIDDRVEMLNLFDKLAPVARPGTGVTGGAPRRVDRLDEQGRVLEADHFDDMGLLRRTHVRDVISGVVTRNTYFDARGSRYIEIDYDPATRASCQVRVYDHEGRVAATHPDEQSLQVEWLRSHAAKHERSLFHSDWWRADSVLARLDHPGAAKVMTLHTNHFRSPYRYGAAVRDRSIVELSLLDKFDAVVFLSEQQRTDVALQFGPRRAFHVVNNFAPPTKGLHDVERDPMLAVGVGRYHKLKGWEGAIDAMSEVVAQVPLARLDLWGFGEEEDALAARIHDRGLDNIVRLRGITHDPARVFASAAFSVLTSPAEGFLPLVCLESMATGTPVVAFSANYGIAEQIENGVNGVLVEPGDTRALALAMTEMFRDTAKREAMGRVAPRIAEQLSVTAYVDAWEKVHEAAVSNAAQRGVRLARADVENLQSHARASGITVTGRLRIIGSAGTALATLIARPSEPGRHTFLGSHEVSLDSDGIAAFSIAIPSEKLARFRSPAHIQLAVSTGHSSVFADARRSQRGPVQIITRLSPAGRIQRRLGLSAEARRHLSRILKGIRRRVGVSSVRP